METYNNYRLTIEDLTDDTVIKETALLIKGCLNDLYFGKGYKKSSAMYFFKESPLFGECNLDLDYILGRYERENHIPDDLRAKVRKCFQ